MVRGNRIGMASRRPRNRRAVSGTDRIGRMDAAGIEQHNRRKPRHCPRPSGGHQHQFPEMSRCHPSGGTKSVLAKGTAILWDIFLPTEAHADTTTDISFVQADADTASQIDGVGHLGSTARRERGLALVMPEVHGKSNSLARLR